MKNTYLSNEGKHFFQKPHLLFEVYLGMFLRNPSFFENKKEPQRNCEQFPGSSASRSLICVRKRRKTLITKHPLSVGDDDGGDGGGDGRISWPPPAPIPSRPGIQYPVRAYPSLRHRHPPPPPKGDRSEGYFNELRRFLIIL